MNMEDWEPDLEYSQISPHIYHRKYSMINRQFIITQIGYHYPHLICWFNSIKRFHLGKTDFLICHLTFLWCVWFQTNTVEKLPTAYRNKAKKKNQLTEFSLDCCESITGEAHLTQTVIAKQYLYWDNTLHISDVLLFIFINNNKKRKKRIRHTIWHAVWQQCHFIVCRSISPLSTVLSRIYHTTLRIRNCRNLFETAMQSHEHR